MHRFIEFALQRIILIFGARLGRNTRPMMPEKPMEGATNQEIICSQLVRISAELRKMELVANASAIDPTILADFRSAVDHARLTAWAVQQQLQMHDDVLDVFPVLGRERIRRVIELCKALIQDDLSSPQAKKEEFAATELLYLTAKRLCDRLEQLRR
jgi:hypothetical protein